MSYSEPAWTALNSNRCQMTVSGNKGETVSPGSKRYESAIFLMNTG